MKGLDDWGGLWLRIESWLSTNHKVSDWIPRSSPHVKMTLGKTLNPKLCMGCMSDRISVRFRKCCVMVECELPWKGC